MRSGRRSTWVLAVALVAAIGLAVASWAVKVPAHPQPFSLPLQQVVSRVPGNPTPAVTLGSDLHVDALKCNATTRSIPDRTAAFWIEIQPPGFTYGLPKGVNKIAPGCTRYHYVIPMPAAVEARARASSAPTTWKLAGTNTAMMTNAQGAYWETEPFEILPS